MKRDSYYKAIPAVIWLVAAALSFTIYPALDDWLSTNPIFDFDLVYLAPGPLFWRPFERINQYIIGQMTGAYPYYFHLLASLGHGFSILLVYLLARTMGASQKVGALAAGVFAISPAVCATAFSVDGSNQAWSTAFGLLSAVAYLRLDRGWKYIGWLAAGIVAVFWKESAIAWFVVAPLMGIIASQNESPAGPFSEKLSAKKVAVQLGIGSLAALAYLIARAVLTDSAIPGPGVGKYTISLAPASVGLNLLMLSGFSLSTIDSLAWFTKPVNWPVLIASGLAGLGLALIALYGLIKYFNKLQWAALIVSALAILSPHVVLTQPSEKHAHPFLAFICIIAAAPAARVARRLGRGPVVGALIAFALASVAVGGHKFYLMYETGQRSSQVGDKLAERLRQMPKADFVCSVVEKGPAAPDEYSVFAGRPGPASYWGYSALEKLGWHNPERFYRVWHAGGCPAQADLMWSIGVDGEIKMIKRLDR